MGLMRKVGGEGSVQRSFCRGVQKRKRDKLRRGKEKFIWGGRK